MHPCTLTTLAMLAAAPAWATTLTVGPEQEFATVAAAVAASADGDTIQVLSGTYVNDFSEITKKTPWSRSADG